MSKHGLSGAMRVRNPGFNDLITKELYIPDHLKSKINLFNPKPASDKVIFIRLSTESGKIFNIYGKTKSKLFKGNVVIDYDIDGDTLSRDNIGSPYNSFNPSQVGIIIEGSQLEKDFNNLIGTLGIKKENASDKLSLNSKQQEAIDKIKKYYEKHYKFRIGEIEKARFDQRLIGSSLFVHLQFTGTNLKTGNMERESKVFEFFVQNNNQGGLSLLPDMQASFK